MSTNNSAANNNRLVQITEQVFDPIRVPIAVGNEVYLVSQQDVRNVVETRMISWEKMQGNNSNNYAAQGAFPGGVTAQDVINYILTVGHSPQPRLNYVQPSQAVDMLKICNLNAAFGGSPNQVVAPIQTQLDWEMKSLPESPPNRFCYCKQTSTSDLKKVKFCIPKYPEFHSCPKCRSSGVNTSDDDFKEDCATEPSAYDKIKRKKIVQSLEFSS